MFSSIIILSLSIGFIYYFIQTKKRLKRYESIINVEDEISRLNKEKDKLSAEINDTRSEYKEKLRIFNELKQELKKSEEEFELTTGMTPNL